MKNRHIKYLSFVLSGCCAVACAQNVPLKQTVEDIVGRLGADSYAGREEAQKQLEGMPRRTAKILRTLTKQDDPEIRMRVLRAIGSFTNAVPIDSVCDDDWQSKDGVAPIESVPLVLRNGKQLLASLESGVMKPWSNGPRTTFLSYKNRVTFKMGEKKRFGFQLAVSKPVRALVTVTYPRQMDDDGVWTSSHTYPSRQVDSVQHFFFDYTRLAQDTPGIFAFSIYINGVKVRALDMETYWKTAKESDPSAGSHQIADSRKKQSSRQNLAAVVEQHIRNDKTVSASSKREGELTIEAGLHGNRYESSELDDLTFLEGLEIQDLTLEALSITNLSPLSSLPLRSLKLHYIGTPDLSPLAALSVTNLNLAVGVTNLAFLRKLPLKSLTLLVPRLQNLSDLKGMKLEKLVVGMKHILEEDISVIGSLPLSDLELHLDGKNCDLSWLSELKQLSRLKLVSSRPVDLSVLKGSSIKELELLGHGFNDISAIKGMKLKVFVATSTRIVDISAVKGMPLEIVNLNLTKVKDLTPLTGAPIKELSIGWTKVTDISALKGMPLKKLDMYGINIKDLSPLADMELERIRMGDLSVVTEGLAEIRAMKSLLYLRATASREPGSLSFRVFEDWAPQFWKQYDKFLAQGVRAVTPEVDAGTLLLPSN